MGYESKIYVVTKSDLKDENDMRYANLIAMFDMGKYPTLSGVFKKQTDCYIFADDGNTKILEDRYGASLTEANIDDVIRVLEDNVYSEEPYRRTLPLLVTLETIKSQVESKYWNNVAILHYGY